MKAVLIVLVIGSTLAGCASARHTTARTTAEGSALPRDVVVVSPDPALLPATIEDDRGRSWSVRDFMQPRGLVQ